MSIKIVFLSKLCMSIKVIVEHLRSFNLLNVVKQYQVKIFRSFYFYTKLIFLLF